MRNRVAAVALCVVALALALPLDRVALAGDEAADELIALEQKMWQAWAKGDMAVFEKYLHEDSVSLTSGSVIWGRADIIESYREAKCEVRSFQLEDVKAHPINDNTVVLTYSAQQDATCAGEKLAPNLLATSLWVREGGQWQVANYQETPVGD